MKNFLPILVLALITFSVQAQQDPLYAQYVNNPMLINPAFAGSLERFYAGIAYRSQWTGIQGMPVTYNLNSHISLLNNRVGAGVYALQDKLGDIQNTSYGMAYAYRIKLHDATLSFGLQAGFTRYATDPEAIRIKNNPDPNFAQFSETNFNTGAGLMFQNDIYMVSFSVPRILTNSVDRKGEAVQVQRQNFYLYGSYIFQINGQLRFKPSALIRATANAKPGIDVNANLEFNRKLTGGVFVRGLNSYGLLAQIVFGDLRFGYVFEVPGKGSALYYTTHEVSLAISLGVLHGHAILNGL